MGIRLKLFFRSIISVNQLSIYGAVSDLCDEYSACQARTERPVLAGQSDPLFEPARLLMTTPTLCVKFLHKKIYCKSTKNEWKGSHNKTDWEKFILMQDSWTQLKPDSPSWQKDTEEFSQFTEQVTCREYTFPRDETSTDPKGWIRGTKIGPVLEVTTSYL